MFHNKHISFLKNSILISTLIITVSFAACGQKEELTTSTEKEPLSDTETSESVASNEEPENLSAISKTEPTELPETSAPEENFGENCIAGQTFEIELSEYDGNMYFVPYAPSAERPEFYMQLWQNGEVLADIQAYVPQELESEPFTSLDAVSFYDVNYDGNTDIVLIETYGSKNFAAIYYGYPSDMESDKPCFAAQEMLSEYLSRQITPLSVPEIQNFLSGGKKNGEFSNYQEAYLAVAKLCESEGFGETSYNLIDFDGNAFPELAAGCSGYYASLYTYDNGKIYTLMEHWPYGAMGNAGYEYVPGKNSLRNFNSDFAGAIIYTTYMKMNDRHALETVAQIETFNFDDVNKNGIPDEDEMDSAGHYSANYIDGREISQEEYDSYEAGEYEFIEGVMGHDELREKLRS